MRMTGKQYRCIEMLLLEGKTVTDTAKELEISRTTIHNWMQDEVFAAEFSKYEQEIKTQANRTFLSRLPVALERLWELTKCSDPRTARAATSEWIERAVGKVGTNIILQSNENGEKDYDISEALLRLADYQDTDKKAPRNEVKAG